MVRPPYLGIENTIPIQFLLRSLLNSVEAFANHCEQVTALKSGLLCCI